MDQKKIERINELARKAKTLEGLTDEELVERAILRREYIDAVTGNLRAQLNNTWVVDERGNRRRLTPFTGKGTS
ncbi:MAG: DUF896 domain-containing protein [Oscillospiraceae bacterium]|nr:DUF896 domain-containing protein [Oscillospiraceae bacterium]